MAWDPKVILPNQQKEICVLPWEKQGLPRALRGPDQPYLGSLPTPPTGPEVHLSSALGLQSLPELCWRCTTLQPCSRAVWTSWLDHGPGSLPRLCLVITELSVGHAATTALLYQ